MRMVEALFAKMAVVYGNEWSRKWEGIPIDQVKGNWEEELQGLTIDQIKYGLSMLPDRPPNLIQFKALCKHAPTYFETERLSYRPIVNQSKREALFKVLENT